MTEKYDVIIIGAGASGLMCGWQAARRGRTVLILDHGEKPGLKLLVSGGGKCNFSNYDVSANNYISNNPHFCKSALSRFSQWDFIELLNDAHILFEERDHSQLFCTNSAKDILDMLLAKCHQNGVSFQLKTTIGKIEYKDGFDLQSNNKKYCCDSLVIATGGLAMPSVGATPFGYEVARQFGIDVLPTKAALVPLTFQPDDKAALTPLSGIAVDAIVSCKKQQFRDNILFTHRGLSGPAILQISSYWEPGDELSVNLLPDHNIPELLNEYRQTYPNRQTKSVFAGYLPKRLVAVILPEELAEKPLKGLNHKEIDCIASCFQQWTIKPNGTEGYRTAEVTGGGVDCNAISSKTMEARDVPGLYFIGEVLDITGWLGGYNLQWAWSSGWCAGQVC